MSGLTRAFCREHAAALTAAMRPFGWMGIHDIEFLNLKTKEKCTF